MAGTFGLSALSVIQELLSSMNIMFLISITTEVLRKVHAETLLFHVLLHA